MRNGMDVLRNIRLYNKNYRKPLEQYEYETPFDAVLYNYRHMNLVAERETDTNYGLRYLIARRIESRFSNKLFCSMWQAKRLQFNFYDTINKMEILEIMDWYIARYGEIEFELTSKKLIVKV